MNPILSALLQQLLCRVIKIAYPSTVYLQCLWLTREHHNRSDMAHLCRGVRSPKMSFGLFFVLKTLKLSNECRTNQWKTVLPGQRTGDLVEGVKDTEDSILIAIFARSGLLHSAKVRIRINRKHLQQTLVLTTTASKTLPSYHSKTPNRRTIRAPLFSGCASRKTHVRLESREQARSERG